MRAAYASGVYRFAQNRPLRKCLSMEVMQTVVAPYLPGLLILGAILFLVGLLFGQLANTRRMRDRGNTVMRYGVLVMLSALALWALVWVMEAWESGAIDAWINSWQ